MRWVCAGLLSLVAALGCADEQARVASVRVASVQAALESAFGIGDADEAVKVIVNLQPSLPASVSNGALRLTTATMQDEMLAMYDDGFSLSRRYKHVPALAGWLTKGTLERLRRDPRVVYVQLDSPGGGQLKEAVPAIGADRLHEMRGLTGKGVTVAVLDTGIVTSHPDLKDSLVGQHCFTQFACPGGMSEAMSAEDDHGHGSNVAGIITSDGLVAPKGFAPGADIVALKVNDSNDSGYESDWVAGLDWIYDNLSMLDVKVINMSICTNQLFADAAACDQGEPAMAQAVKNLVDAGVVIFSASGNRGSTSAMSAPACNTGVIAVGATYDSSVGKQPPTGSSYSARWGSSFADCADGSTAFDQVTCFTNSPPRLDLVAPGAPMLSDSLNGQTETYWGTSQASPVAAAVAALMLECSPGLPPDRIKEVMIGTAVPVVDPKNNRMFPSLRAFAAVSQICGDDVIGSGGAGGGSGSAGSAGGAGSAGSAGSAGMPVASNGGAPAMIGTGGAGGVGASGAGGAAMTGDGTNGAGGVLAMAPPGDGSRDVQTSCGCMVPGGRTETTARAAWLGAAVAACLARRRSRTSRRRRRQSR